MNEALRAAILAELVEAAQIRVQQSWEFTRNEFAECAGCTYETGSRILDEWVKDGKLCQAKALVDGRRVWVYWRPEDVPAEGHG